MNDELHTRADRMLDMIRRRDTTAVPGVVTLIRDLAAALRVAEADLATATERADRNQDAALEAQRRVQDANDRAHWAETDLATARTALTEVCDAFDECTGDYAKELVADDLARWRAVASVASTPTAMEDDAVLKAAEQADQAGHRITAELMRAAVEARHSAPEDP